MTGAIYRGLKNQTYTLTQRIGGGGEGEVYAVNEDSTLVLKYYKEALGRDKVDKLSYMVSLTSDELLRFAAWPLDLVRDQSGKPCGFTMKKLEGYVPLHMLFTPGDRKNIFPDKGYNFLMHVARNLAVAFHKVHQREIIVGDVNEANILVNNSGMVAFIDCDSFQIKNGTRYHYCEVGMLRYTPPELLRSGGFYQTVRTKNTDAFSLATLIFQLLFLGRAPFTGINPGSQEIDEETAIKGQEFAYSLRKNNKRLFPAKNSLSINTLSPGIINAFHAAFESTDNRPPAFLWANELGVQIKDLVICNKSKLHHYPARVSFCPWCEFKEKYNIHYFMDDSYLRGMPELNNIEQFVNGFKLDSLQVKPLSQSYQVSGVAAQLIPQQFQILKMINWIVYLAIVITTVVLCIQNFAYVLCGIIALLIFANISPTRRKLRSELAIRKEIFDQFNNAFTQVVKQHNGLPEYGRYNDSAKKLSSAIEAFRALPAEYAKNKKTIEDKHYQIKFLQFLSRFEVLYAQINGVGPAKKRAIYAGGIRTAAEVGKLRKIKIAGIGPRNEQLLYDWQRQVGAGFTYQPDNTVIAAEIGLAANAILKKRQQLESEIRQQYQLVSSLRAQIVATVKTLENKYKELQPKIYQAELNYQAFQKIAK